jgi:hypothetical protein
MPTATIVVKGNNCHTSLWGVMANHGFGRLTIIRDGVKYMLPKEAVFKSGKIKKKYMTAIEEYRIGAAA